MVDTLYPVNAVAGAPEYSGRMLRQTAAVAFAGATSARPLGARSGVRPGTPVSVGVTGSTAWYCNPIAGVADAELAIEAGPYLFAFDAQVGGALTAADASNPRIDIVYVQVDDPSESDGSSVPAVIVDYLAGTAAAVPVAPATPARSFVLAKINVPISGGGSPTVSWVAPYCAAAGGTVLFTTKAELDLWTTVAEGQRARVLATGYEYVRFGAAWVVVLEDTGWITASLFSPWVLNTQAPAYRRVNGIVYFRGRATAGSATGSPIFTLPVGFRPAATRVQGLDAGGTYTRSQIQITGDVGPVVSGTYTGLSIDGIAPYPVA